jgi:hypothetical protein
MQEADEKNGSGKNEYRQESKIVAEHVVKAIHVEIEGKAEF